MNRSNATTGLAAGVAGAAAIAAGELPTEVLEVLAKLEPGAVAGGLVVVVVLLFRIYGAVAGHTARLDEHSGKIEVLDGRVTKLERRRR